MFITRPGARLLHSGLKTLNVLFSIHARGVYFSLGKNMSYWLVGEKMVQFVSFGPFKRRCLAWIPQGQNFDCVESGKKVKNVKIRVACPEFGHMPQVRNSRIIHPTQKLWACYEQNKIAIWKLNNFKTDSSFTIIAKQFFTSKIQDFNLSYSCPNFWHGVRT